MFTLYTFERASNDSGGMEILKGEEAQSVSISSTQNRFIKIK